MFQKCSAEKIELPLALAGGCKSIIRMALAKLYHLAKALTRVSF